MGEWVLCWWMQSYLVILQLFLQSLKGRHRILYTFSCLIVLYLFFSHIISFHHIILHYLLDEDGKHSIYTVSYLLLVLPWKKSKQGRGEVLKTKYSSHFNRICKFVLLHGTKVQLLCSSCYQITACVCYQTYHATKVQHFFCYYICQNTKIQPLYSIILSII